MNAVIGPVSPTAIEGNKEATEAEFFLWPLSTDAAHSTVVEDVRLPQQSNDSKQIEWNISWRKSLYSFHLFLNEMKKLPIASP